MTTRWRQHLQTFCLLSGVVLSGLGLAQQNPPGIIAPKGKAAQPNSYATLVFKISGQGKYRFTVQATKGLEPLFPTPSLSVSGTALLFVSVHLPQSAPAGTVGRVTVSDQARPRVSASSTVRVTAYTAVGISMAPSVTSNLNQTTRVGGYVSNLGNRTETIQLRVVGGSWPVTLSLNRVTLKPGGDQRFTATVYPQNSVLSGYRYVLEVRAAAEGDLHVEQKAQSTLVFKDLSQVNATRKKVPTLVLGLKASAADQLELQGGQWTNTLKFGLSPNLQGQLSDYARAQLLPGGLTGNGSSLAYAGGVGLGFSGPGWSTSFSTFGDQYNASAGLDIGSRWHMSIGAGYTASRAVPGISARLGAFSLDPAFDFQTTVSASFSPLGQNQQLGLLYRKSFGDTLRGSVGVQLNGMARTGGYWVVPGLTQSLHWRPGDLSLTENYYGLPTLSFHSLALSGSSLGNSALSWHAQTQFVLESGAQSLASGLTLYGFPGRRLGLSLSGRYSTTASESGAASFGLAPQLSWGFNLLGQVQGSLVLGYQRTFPVAGTAAASEDYNASLLASLGPASLSLSGGYAHSQGSSRPEGGLAAINRWQTQAALGYQLGPSTLLGASYQYANTLQPQQEQVQTYGLGWRQIWAPWLQSSFNYSAANDAVLGLATNTPASLSADLLFSNLFPGLAMDLGYTLSNTVGLFSPGVESTQNFRFSLRYGLNLAFSTPSSIVKLFGGRKTGLVHGAAYTLKDGIKKPLAGLTVQLGAQKTITSKEGAYQLRVAPGAYILSFPAGLPATLGLLGTMRQEVVVDKRAQRDLVFVPVTNMTVTLFKDASQHGHFAPGDPGIPYGGVIVSGPVTRHLRTDADGRVVVSGLPSGTYSVRPAPDFLPPGYKPTTEPIEVQVHAPIPPPPIFTGANQPPKTIVTTFSSGMLSVFAFVQSGQVPAGADLIVHAQVTGSPKRVEISLLGRTVDMRKTSGSFVGTLRIPPSAPHGLAQGTVTAYDRKQSADTPIQVLVTGGASFFAQPVSGTVNQAARVKVVLKFRAKEVTLELAGRPLPLKPLDAYTWQATYTPSEPLNISAKLIADGKELGTVPVRIRSQGQPSPPNG